MTFDFHADALREYEQAGVWYEEQRHRLGVEFVETIGEAIATVLRDPKRYQPVAEGVRIFRVKRFPYYIYFKFFEARAHVRILAVMHHKRRPGLWRSRID